MTPSNRPASDESKPIENPREKIDYGAEATNPALRTARFDSQTTPKGEPLDPLYTDPPQDV